MRGFAIRQAANSRNVTKSGAFRTSEKLALVNNAGIFFAKPFTEFTGEDFDALATVNLKGFLYVTQGSVKQMLKQKNGGSVVSITSSLVVNPVAGVPASVPMITKGGLEAVTRSLASSESRLAALGIELRPAPTPFGACVESVQVGGLLYLTGMLPTVGDKSMFVGKIGREFNVEQGREAATVAALNAISNARQHLGSLEKAGSGSLPSETHSGRSFEIPDFSRSRFATSARVD